MTLIGELRFTTAHLIIFIVLTSVDFPYAPPKTDKVSGYAIKKPCRRCVYEAFSFSPFLLNGQGANCDVKLEASTGDRVLYLSPFFCIFIFKIMQMKKEAGYVYILTNPSFKEDWVKIGKSSRPVDVRSKELDNTAVPMPFEIYATLKTSKYEEVEKFTLAEKDR